MGDIYDEHAAMADMIETGAYSIPAQATEPEGFDVAPAPAAETDGPETPVVAAKDPMRPEAVRGRYTLPNPLNGKSKSWRRVTNFTKVSEDTYHLELWKQRNVAKGVAMLAEAGRLTTRDLARKDVKLDREWVNNVCSAAQDVAEAYKMADEGTALHKSTELADYAGGNLDAVPAHHRLKVGLYLDALASRGIRVVPGMIERVTASSEYECAGKFDRVYLLADGSYVIGDLKTGDDLELSMPSIAAQLDAYRNGINNHGIFDGQRYDDRIKVRDDFGVVIHLPSTRDEVSVIPVDLAQGRRINETNLTVLATRKVKARHVRLEASVLDALSADEQDAYWLERLNAAHTPLALVDVAKRARVFGQWNERLAAQARLLADELRRADAVMGS